MSQDNLLTVKEVAAILGAKPRTVIRWVELGYFPDAYKLGLAPNSPFRIPQSNVDAFMEQRERQAKAVTSKK